MINRTVLVGRITRDPEVKKTQTGVSVVSFTLAVNRPFKTQDNQQDADFINCVAWRNSADFLGNYIKKGALLGVEGRLQSRTYEDQTGRTVYVQEVVCDTVQSLESRAQREASQGYQQAGGFTPQVEPSFTQPSNAKESDEPLLDITTDDLPF